MPAATIAAFFRKQWQIAFLVMMSTMLVDLDHLLAEPVFDPDRCSIGYHPLHEPAVFPVYILLTLHPKTRYLGIGLLIHMLLDSVDCQITSGVWIN